jgi:aminopeptidase-like protein
MTHDDRELGRSLMAMIERMYPICRSITGDGVRDTLAIVGEQVDLEIREVPSGTEVLDWTVPPEWNIRDAYVANAAGERVIDFRTSNLHVVSYSVPVRRHMTLAELRPHLYSLPDQPSLVPYRTSYYEEAWGFCVADDVLRGLPDGEYEVVIDSTLAVGSLTYGEVVVPGSLDSEVLVSSHVCHPSLCDDNLSGIAVSTALAARIAAGPTPRHTFRFVFAPGTIGAITWLAEHRDRVDSIVAGLTLTCLGDEHPFTFKQTERTGSLIDRAATHVLGTCGADHEVIEFFPYGYDERQFNAPGFRAPVGSLMRGRHGRFPEYHTSADDLSFVSPERLVESFHVLRDILDVADRNRVFTNLQPDGEPQLGARGLYRALGGVDIADAQLAMLWVLNQSDGDTDLLAISERSALPFHAIAATAQLLEAHELLAERPAPHAAR